MSTFRFLAAFAAVTFTFAMATPPAAHAGFTGEIDSLHCVKAKDVNAVVGGPVSLNDDGIFAIPGCTLSKVASVCIPTVVNGSDDVHGPAITGDGYLCFKAKCDGTAPGGGAAVITQFGTSDVNIDQIKGTKQICVPYNFAP